MSLTPLVFDFFLIIQVEAGNLDQSQIFPGFKEPKPMVLFSQSSFSPSIFEVYGGIFPMSGDAYVELSNAITKLQLTDPSVVVNSDNRYFLLFFFFFSILKFP